MIPRTMPPRNCTPYQQDLIDPVLYHRTVQALRHFFEQKGFLEVHTQSRLSILAACEDPTTIQTYSYEGQVWPLPQTGQMWLEYELLTKPEAKGFYCLSTSFRQEPNPVPGRHKTIFPMFEFETHGGVESLAELERELLAHLGLSDGPVPEANYADLAARYGVEILGAAEEDRIWKEYGDSFLLRNFPVHTSPFWNMRMENGVARKIDVICCGQETIGSAERAVDKAEMREMFHTISGGAYASTLHGIFGKDRVEAELEEFLSLDFFPRFGGGIGVTRLMRAMEMVGAGKLEAAA